MNNCSTRRWIFKDEAFKSVRRSGLNYWLLFSSLLLLGSKVPNPDVTIEWFFDDFKAPPRQNLPPSVIQPRTNHFLWVALRLMQNLFCTSREINIMIQNMSACILTGVDFYLWWVVLRIICFYVLGEKRGDFASERKSWIWNFVTRLIWRNLIPRPFNSPQKSEHFNSQGDSYFQILSQNFLFLNWNC